MNIRNEADEALDRAFEKYLEKLCEAFFVDRDVVKLASELRRAADVYVAANKALDTL